MREGNRARFHATAAALMAAAVLMAIPALAHEARSVSFQLRGGTLAGGGGDSSGSLGELQATIGQGAPATTSEGPVTGIVLSSGAWPVMGAQFVPEPGETALVAALGLAALAHRRRRGTP